jgi:hypothetical protein
VRQPPPISRSSERTSKGINMSSTVAVMNVQDTTLSLIGHQDDDRVPEGKVGLVIASTTGEDVLIIGTPHQLRQQVYAGFFLPVPAGVPLVDEDPLDGANVVVVFPIEEG